MEGASTRPGSCPALSWGALPDADHYVIYRDAVSIGTTTTTTFVDAALAVDGTYAYQVSAVSTEDYEGPKSTSVSVVHDTTAPVVGAPVLSVNPKRTTETSILSATATDAGSGVAGGEYFVGVNDPGPGQGPPDDRADRQATRAPDRPVHQHAGEPRSGVELVFLGGRDRVRHLP
jgi:fibronectin type 3 domain-containing protein